MLLLMVALLYEGVALAKSPLPRLQTTLLCRDCFAEPVETEYWGGSLFGEPPRLQLDGSAEGRAKFDAAARAGKVLILGNATVGSALDGWSCEKLADELPGARMRREYDWGENPDDDNLQRMGNKDWILEKTRGEDASERSRQDSKTPPFAPFYWGVREHRNGQVGDRDTLRKVKGLIEDSVPPFMDPRNKNALFEQAEFWLGAKGTGARAHMDSHCISTLSVVLKGQRRWRIGPPPRMPKNGGRSRDEEVVFDDGVAYMLKWKPMYEFIVKEGEALMFPPGWLHETYNVADGCTVALTTQFEHPRPAAYYREYYSRLRRVGDLHACWDQMQHWASSGKDLLSSKVDQGDGAVTAKEIPENKAAVFDFYDGDADRTVSPEEIDAIHQQWRATESAARKEKTRHPSKLKFDMGLGPPDGGSQVADEL